MEIDVFTLFPEAFDWFERQRHVATALGAGHRLGYVNYRDHTPLRAGQVDDTPFGGGAGMLLRVDVVEAALRARYEADPVAVAAQRRVIALTPAGRLLDDALVDELAAEPALTLLCGRYEGFDERILEHFVSDQVSIGRYVLAGGELAAMVLCDAVLRKLPGALGDERSALGSPSARRWTARRSTRITPGRRSSGGGGCPRFCSPDTTPGSASGAWPRAQRAPGGVRYHRPPVSDGAVALRAATSPRGDLTDEHSYRQS